MMDREMRVCLAASAGGHASALLKLHRCWEGLDCFAVTTSKVLEKQFAKYGRVYVVEESNRLHPLKVLRTLAGCVKIVLRERPAVILSTGAAVGCIMALLGRSLGARIAWVDSIANTEHLSLSGRLVRPFADLVLTQWPEVAQRHKGVEYVGYIL
jgi:UDP-N-acetylglucosamine:LPS N-acetylglucosamine transferase